MRGFRAYVILHRDYIPASHAPRGSNARIVMRDNTATGMETITNDQLPITNKIIRDNRLIIIRDGGEYNAQGQIVK